MLRKDLSRKNELPLVQKTFRIGLPSLPCPLRKLQNYDFKIKRIRTVKNCGICEIELTNDKSKTQRCIDHDHDTGRIRGVLCSLCNMAEGQIKSMQIGPAEYGRRLEKWMENS